MTDLLEMNQTLAVLEALRKTLAFDTPFAYGKIANAARYIQAQMHLELEEVSPARG